MARTALLTIAIIALAGCTAVRVRMMKRAIPVDYFETETGKPDQLDHISGNIYAFRHQIDRALVVVTDDGISVFDPFSTELASRLAAVLATRFPGKPVRRVFYSHNHLDHIRGAAALAPIEVIAHTKVMSYVDDFAHDDIAPPTRVIDGDVDIDLGGVTVRCLYLGHSHTDTLYAYYFPVERVLFAPDMAFVHTMPPFGLPDWYYPGYIRALDRLIALDVGILVPTHFGLGVHADLVAYRRLLVDFRAVGERTLRELGGQPARGQPIRDRFVHAYYELRERYGDWHGYDAMFVPQFVGALGGAYLGY